MIKLKKMNRGDNINMDDNQQKDSRWHNRTGKESGKSPADDLGEWIQDMIQDAVDSMDFSGLAQNIRDAVSSAKNEMGEQVKKKTFSHTKDRQRQERYGRRVYETDRRVQRPAAERQPQERGWMRRIPGQWSGPARMIAGGSGLVVFGALVLGFGFAGLGFGMLHGAISTATIVLESVFIPLTILSGVLFGMGRAAGKRVKRIREYARIWGDRGFVMLDDLKKGTGYAMKRIKKDLQFLLERRLIPYARMDESNTCLILSREAGEQYDAAVQARLERERQEQQRQAESRQTAGQQSGAPGTDAAAKRPEDMTEEERKMYHLQQTGGSYLQEIRERKQRIHTPEVSEKLDRLELLLGRIFVCIKEYPENLSQADRLLEYYLPSVMKLIRVYEDMEKQPIQSVNIIKTRMEIAESLDTVNQALEAMYDDMFQDVAMDISSDIKVLETMLAKDGWGGQEMHSQADAGSSIWD
ncbi:MAG TPA: 5-bromo-4-chloroindolyl phosphate hydrolysis family protein [Candidatus Anaerobutyricum avicola]|nr:5-bromo-4-chloroindolyl phosphate hydrolysis family protein [Candidatus Anaerobutyricum avicola]